MKRILILLLAATLSGCGIGTWLAGGESNLEPPTPLAELSNPISVVSHWTEDFGGGNEKAFIKIVPLVRDGMVYMADTTGRVKSMESATGKRVWDVSLNLPVTAGIGYGDGLLLLGTKKGQVIALTPKDGKTIWTASLTSEILAPPTADSGIVVAQTVDGNVFGLSSSTGERVWTFVRNEPALSLRGTAAPVVVSGMVLAGFANGRIVAINLSDGHQIWEIPVTQPRGRSEIERLVDVDSSPLVVGKVMYAAAYQGKIIAVNLENGRILWSRELSTFNEMAADQSNLYVTDERGEVYALDLGSGATSWKQEKLRARFPSGPGVAGQHIAVGDYEGFVHWLAREDGRLVGRYRAGGAIRVRPSSDKTGFYVATQKGSLHALRVSR